MSAEPKLVSDEYHLDPTAGTLREMAAECLTMLENQLGFFGTRPRVDIKGWQDGDQHARISDAQVFVWDVPFEDTLNLQEAWVAADAICIGIRRMRACGPLQFLLEPPPGDDANLVRMFSPQNGAWVTAQYFFEDAGCFLRFRTAVTGRRM